MSGLGQDLVFAVRTLRRRPGFAVTVLLTVAVGVGGVTTMFSLFDHVVLRPLPYPDPDELVFVGARSEGGEAGNTGFETWLDWRAGARSFEDLAMIRSWSPTLIRDRAERLAGVRVTWQALDLLGARFALGRGFVEAEDRPNENGVVVLSDRAWRTHFGADPDILGRSLDLAGRPYRVVGVLDPDFRPLLSQHLYQAAEIYAPLGYSTELAWACRSCQHLVAFGRLAEGATVDSAAAEVNGIHRRLVESHPLDYDGEPIVVEPFHQAIVREAEPALAVLLAAVSLILVIACVNVGSLLLARGGERRRELVIRRALGAERARIVRQLMTENALLAGLGGALGAVGAVFAIPLIVRASPVDVPRLGETTLDLKVLGFALLATAVAALLFGLLPAFGASAERSPGVLASRGQRADRRQLGRRLLVVTNLALALILLTGALLTVKSVDRLLGAEPGFSPQGVLTAKLSLIGDPYREDGAALAAFDRLLERAAALPGVETAAISSQIPFGGNWDSWGVEIEGRPHESAADAETLQRYSVTPDYFRALEIPLVSGRLLDGTDSSGSLPVVVLGETSARQIFGDEDALGKRLRFGDDEGWRTVVGVVGDVKHEGLASAPIPAMYLPIAQFTDRFVVLSLRTRGGVSGLARALRAMVAEVGRDIPVYDVAWLADLAGASAARERFLALLLVAFAAVACFLSAIGLYGLIAFLVERRRGEVGVRIALGALRRHVAGLVFRQGVALVGLGLLIGSLLAFVVTRSLAGLLYDISPTDLATYVEVALLLGLVALAALAVPLTRALRIQPTEALRED